MTVDELHEKFGFKDPTIIKGKLSLNPIYRKHLPACWIIQDIYGHVEQGNISLGKARELTAAVIEKYQKQE